MLIRLVRMTFRDECLPDFHRIFDISKAQIRAFPGCRHLELLRDLDQPAVRLTLSHWESADALDAYRRSGLFRTTWAATKVLFADRPVAFSMETIEVI